MDNLTSSLAQLSKIEQLIYEHNGELSTFTEEELNQASLEVQQRVESVAWAYKKRQAEVEYLKKQVKGAIKMQEERLAKFKEVILSAAKASPVKLKTPMASISVTERTNLDVLIIDFDLVTKTVPESVTITVEDNEKTIRLSKKILKEHFKDREGVVHGYDVTERKSEYPNVRIKGGQANTFLDYGP